jgi:DNA-binding protein HU-beta
MSSITKSALLDRLSNDAGCDKKTCARLLEALAEIVKDELASTGEVTIPGITKLKAKVTPAKKTRMGINPFTRQPMEFKSKPASMKVKSFALKNIKDVFAQ